MSALQRIDASTNIRVPQPPVSGPQQPRQAHRHPDLLRKRRSTLFKKCRRGATKSSDVYCSTFVSRFPSRMPLIWQQTAGMRACGAYRRTTSAMTPSVNNNCKQTPHAATQLHTSLAPACYAVHPFWINEASRLNKPPYRFSKLRGRVLGFSLLLLLLLLLLHLQHNREHASARYPYRDTDAANAWVIERTFQGLKKSLEIQPQTRNLSQRAQNNASVYNMNNQRAFNTKAPAQACAAAQLHSSRALQAAADLTAWVPPPDLQTEETHRHLPAQHPAP
jgi:hypothetical protein